MTVVASTNDLARLLEDVAPFAEQPDAEIGYVHPFLGAVLLHTDGNRLVATATDRFTLAQGHIECDGDLAPTQLPILHAHSVRLMLSGSDATLTRIETGHKSVTFTAGTASSSAENLLEPHGMWSKLSTLWCAPEPGGQILLDSKLMGRVVAVAERRGEPLRITPGGPEQAQHVAVGDRFRGLMMPQRRHPR